MSYLRGPLTRNQIKTLMDPIKAASPAAYARRRQPRSSQLAQRGTMAPSATVQRSDTIGRADRTAAIAAARHPTVLCSGARSRRQRALSAGDLRHGQSQLRRYQDAPRFHARRDVHHRHHRQRDSGELGRRAADRHTGHRSGEDAHRRRAIRRIAARREQSQELCGVAKRFRHVVVWHAASRICFTAPAPRPCPNPAKPSAISASA